MSEASTHLAFVDRIEGDTAVLLLGEEGRDRADLPRAYLPPGAGEGSYLRMTLAVDPATREQVRQEVENLLAELLGEPPAEEN